jgi:hypothetical protein
MRLARAGAAAAVVACMLWGTETTAGQEVHRPTRVWLAAGPASGAGTSVEAGVGLLAAIAWQKQPHQVTFRALTLTDLAGFPDSGGGDAVAEVGLLYGRVRPASFGHASASAGLALVTFGTCPGRRAQCHTAGVPLVVEAATSLTVIGIGLQAFANVNLRSPYGGLAAFIQLGRL